MKTISLIAAAILLGACSTHRVRCHGGLRPINKPAAVAIQPKGKESRP